MTRPKKLLAQISIALILISHTAPLSRADDRSFSSVVKYIQKNYKGERQGAFGMITFGRFLVKLIRPAGVKNFKIVMFKSVDFSRLTEPEDLEFQNFVRTTVHPKWQPLVQYSSRRNKQWSYVYSQVEKEDMKFLVVALQQKQAFVVQVKFSPEKLIAFIDDPKIIGISLKDKTDPKSAAAGKSPSSEAVQAKSTSPVGKDEIAPDKGSNEHNKTQVLSMLCGLRLAAFL